MLGDWHKQGITNKQIFDTLKSEGFDIGQCTINNALARLREDLRNKQVFIRQQYDFGERLEYDFGEDTGIWTKKTLIIIMVAFMSNCGILIILRLYIFDFIFL